ncbi:MAG: cytochrome c biogenesis protein CcdA [Candidatus Pacearchaeota archaeon]
MRKTEKINDSKISSGSRWTIFLSSVFFVLGFSVVFAILGVLLQTVLSGSSYTVQKWLGRIGGTIIILFGLYLVGLIRPAFLERDYKIQVKKKFSSRYLTAFVFGAAFAVGWSPCVGAILGAILTLAVTSPGSSFLLLLSYSLGLGIPFLIVGLFTNKAQGWISKYGKTLRYLNYIFGAFLIILGILVFTSQLSRVANFSFATQCLNSLGVSGFGSGASLNIFIAFIAGLISFLSPCVLPLIPAFLAYLGSTVTQGGKNE